MGESQLQRQTVVVYARQMLTFALLDNWLPRLLHPAVRDLAWTLLAPPLLADTPCPQRHPLTASGWAQNPQQLADWLHVLDQHPEALLDWLNTARSQRLGIYYERLWQFALRQAPGLDVLAANIPVRAGGLTLGELDLLLRDAEGAHHLELAIKLYLGPSSFEGQLHSNWRGAGRADNLERKLKHLADQQLTLSSTVEAQQILSTYGVKELHPELWMSGYLFYPWPHGCNSPAGMHPSAQHGRWLQRRDWPGLLADKDAHFWQPLPRDCRLAPLRVKEGAHWTSAQLDDWIQSLPTDAKPALLAGLEQMDDGSWRETQRVMLLNDQWPADLTN